MTDNGQEPDILDEARLRDALSRLQVTTAPDHQPGAENDSSGPFLPHFVLLTLDLWGPTARPSRQPPPGRDVIVRLDPHLRVTPSRRRRGSLTKGWQAAGLHALALALGREARTIYVHGGNRDVRHGVALVLGTAYGSRVLWDDPEHDGPQAAPRRLLSPPGRRRG